MLGRQGEQEALDRLLAAVRSGRSQVLVVRGEAGIGKTALLNYLAEQPSGCAVLRATGVQGEMEVPFAGLQQLFGSMLGPLEHLPDRQREAIEVAFALRSGPRPDRMLLGLAVSGLMAELAEERPLLCAVDDAQWLDRASAQALGFAARRLLGEAVALVVAVREPGRDDMFRGLPALVVRGLRDEDARGLLASVFAAPLDDQIVDRAVAETRGNPLALMALTRGLSRAQLAGGFGLPAARSVSRRIEEHFRRRLDALPEETRRLLLLAAAEPLGDPDLLLRAAERLGLSAEAATPAEAAGLLELGAHVQFRHTIVRSAVYQAAPLAERQAVHRALAEATDAQLDPDRRAWHRAQAAVRLSEDVAGELERSVHRAQARGGMAATGAFLERAAALTPGPAGRARRAVAAAQANQLAGLPEATSKSLDIAAAGPLDELDEALVQQLRGRVALHLNRSGEAVPLLRDAARRLESLEPRLARDAHLEALYAASVAGRLGPGMADAAKAARAAPPGPSPSPAVDLLLDGLAARFTDGYGVSAPILKRALATLLAGDRPYSEFMPWPCPLARIAAELFDDESCELLARRRVQRARDRGALAVLPAVLPHLALVRAYQGNLDAAAALTEEAESIRDATDCRRISVARMALAAFRGDEAQAEQLIAQAERDANARGEGVVLTYAEHARAVLYNGLGHYDAALAAAQQACAQDELGVRGLSLAELVEAAARSGNPRLAADTLERLCERTQVAGSEWALGLEARSRALVSDGKTAARFYRVAIERLGRCRLAFELARAHLVYGEWLRRERRRIDARTHLRRAQQMFNEMGAQAFADRCARELVATGETARKWAAETRDELTPRELRIAGMARDGASNQEIATQLFVSHKTVEYHLHKVFQKLGISSREHLDRVLPAR